VGTSSLVSGSIVGAEVTVGAEVKVGVGVGGAVSVKHPVFTETKINVKKRNMIIENLVFIKFNVFCVK
jgi:hypothetical protein